MDVPNTKPRYLLEFILHKRRLWDIDLIELKELVEVTVTSMLVTDVGDEMR